MAMEDVNERIKEEARSIACDLAGPAGQIALDRVVARHLEWFDLCQQRGMSWPQIASALHAAGAGRETGLPFSHSHLSAVVWRQRQKATMTPPAGVEEKGSEGARSRPVQKRAPKPAPPAVARPAPKAGQDAPHARKNADVASGKSRGETGAEAGANRTPVQSDFEAYAKRAANIRRSRDDD